MEGGVSPVLNTQDMKHVGNVDHADIDVCTSVVLEGLLTFHYWSLLFSDWSTVLCVMPN